MTSTDDELVSRLQAHLSTIRKAAGWSGERLANELGITKQTVSSLETGKTQMTKMHYLAIRRYSTTKSPSAETRIWQK